MSGEISLAPTEEMLQSAYRTHYSALRKKQIVFYLVFGGLVGLVLAAVDGFSSASHALKLILAMLLWALVVLVVIILLTRYWWLPRFTRRVFQQQSDLRHPFIVRWNDDAYETEIPSGKITTPWSDFYQWRRGKDILLLYRSEALFNFFPTTGEGMAEIADAIQGHLIVAGVKEKT
ncbi:YcxB family protein [Sphingorhabdus sp.]|jgi:hypothetical protein|uniref:YcxB family protein n=1 Tax=Sphingorhabdus sp. TaxID=1902408 RepID=UPI003BB1C507|nr:YcxB family protein [Sphingomonadales bacterium]